MKALMTPAPAQLRKLLLSVTILTLSLCLRQNDVSAHTIDYLATSISPAAMFHGHSGNFSLIDNVDGSAEIKFQLTFSINPAGSTTSFPRTIMFGVKDITKPLGAADPTVMPSNPTYTFTGLSSSFTTEITIAAPDTPGAYSVKIAPVQGTGGPQGLNPGGGIVVHFTVTTPCASADTATELVLENACLVYRAASTSFAARLTAQGAPVAGKTIEFTVDGNYIGSDVTDAQGIAFLSYDPSGLAVGDHSVAASFQGDGCDYNSSSNSNTLGVQYMFLGFQQPINADGSSQFSGNSVPVKIKIADANGMPVSDAVAHMYYTYVTTAVTGTQPESSAASNGADTGNQLRYDAGADQYILNWDVSGLSNGTYVIRVGLGEGVCAPAHTVAVSLNKKGKK